MVKASACNAGDPGSIPGSGRCPGEGNGNPLRTLAWKIPGTEEPGRLQCTGCKESDTTEQLHFLLCYLYQRPYKWVFYIWMRLYFYLFVFRYCFWNILLLLIILITSVPLSFLPSWLLTFTKMKLKCYHSCLYWFRNPRMKVMMLIRNQLGSTYEMRMTPLFPRQHNSPKRKGGNERVIS